ncbi:MAG: protein kinase [Gemmataceae bacterium]
MSTGELTYDFRGRRSKLHSLNDLLDKWEEEYEKGRDVPCEELCGDCPELEPALAQRIAFLKKMVWLSQPMEGCSVEASSQADLSRVQHNIPGAPTIRFRFEGRFRLERLIGEGGFGQVWEGFDEKLERPVALKVPKPGRRLSADQTQRFVAEARKLAKLRHPGIVAVHDVLSDDKGCFIVSDLVNGMDLRKHLLSGPLPVKAALRIVAETAEALHHAHQQGFVHRDTKPGNILVDDSGRVFVTDFGIAATNEEIRQQDGSRCGTPGYMSPEQHAGEGIRIDRRTDIYSLGVVLYEALTGVRPFESNNIAALQDQLPGEKPQPPSALNKEVSKQVDTICLKCLAIRPDERYASAQEVAVELRRQLGQRERAVWREWVSLAVAVSLVFFTAYRGFVTDSIPSVFGNVALNDMATPRDLELEKGMERLWAKDYQNANKHFDACLAYRKSITVLSVKGEAHMALGEYDNAIQCCDVIIHKQPDFSKAHFIKGLAYKAMSKPALALECFGLAAKYGEGKAEEEIRSLQTRR